MSVVLDRYAPSWGTPLPKRTRVTLHGGTPTTLREHEPTTFHRGTGTLSGSFPVHLISGTASVRALVRSSIASANGYIAGTSELDSEGKWLIEGLNTDLTYDVVVELPGYNSVIISDVSPKT